MIKSLLMQLYLRYKFSKGNIIERNISFSKDTIIEGNSFVGESTVFGDKVKVCRNVRIGENVRLSNITIGENSFIESGVICTGHGNGKIEIGKESYIGLRNILDWSDNIKIGNYVHIAGPSTGLWTHSSAKMCLNNIPLSKKDDKNYRPTAEILIENNVYVGGNCTVYPGVTIHHHAIVTPNSAVTKDVSSYTIVGGVPAKMIKKIKK